MRVRDSYDLIVIGDQLSGLLLAAGASQMGFKVLVLEESSVPTVSYEIPSGKFLGDFLAEPIIGLKPEGEVDRFFRSLGLYQNADELFPLHAPSLQIVGKGLRLDFAYGEDLGSHVSLELPGQPKNLANLLSGRILHKGTYSEAVAKAGLSVEWEKTGWMQTALYGAIASENVSYSSYKEVLTAASHGVRFTAGGRTALKERLVSRILYFGGAIKKSTRVEQIIFERGRLSGVLLSSYEGFVRSSKVVGAMGAMRFLELVPEEFRSAKLKKFVGSTYPRFWRLSFTLLVPEKLLPVGAGTHLAFTGAENFLQVQIFPKENYGGIPMGHKALVGRVLVPFTTESLSAKSIATYLKKARMDLEKVFPFLQGRDLVCSPDPGNLERDPVFHRHLDFASLEHIPPSLLVYESVSSAVEQKVFADWSKFGLSGLSLCSRDIYPLFGFIGEAYAAMDYLNALSKQKTRSGG